MNRYIIITLLFVLGLSAAAYADNANVAAADTAYAHGEYSKAVELYTSEIAKSGDNAAILYNLGNAYTKLNDFGRARLAYERAKRLDPSDKQINGNLDWLANKVADQNRLDAKGKQISFDEPSSSFFGGMYRVLAVNHSSNLWAWLAACSFILCLAFAALYIFTRMVAVRKIGFFGMGISLLICIVFIAFAALAASHITSDSEGVITAVKTELLKEPQADAKSNEIPLHRGTKLMITDKSGGTDDKPAWYKVRLNSDVNGWISADSFEVI